MKFEIRTDYALTICLYKQEKPKRLRNESTADLRMLGSQLRKLYSKPYNPYPLIVSWLDPFDRKLSYASLGQSTTLLDE